MEDLIKKTKKNTTVQLLKKVEKVSGEEFEAVIEVLKSRGQDVSKWVKEPEQVEEPTQEEPEQTEESVKNEDEIKAELIKKVDSFVEKIINEGRTGLYNQVMKALGGKFDDDIDELYAAATLSQLRDAYSFHKIQRPSEKEETVEKKKSSAKKSSSKESDSKEKKGNL